MPAWGAGISREALSDSMTMRGSSTATRSPGFTQSSITSTSEASPSSGTVTEIMSGSLNRNRIGFFGIDAQGIPGFEEDLHR